MAFGVNPTEADYLQVKQRLWEKFADRLQEWRNSQSCVIATPLKLSSMNPDVIVIVKNNTLLFEPQTPQAATWLQKRFRLTAEDMDGQTGILVHPHQQTKLTDELKAAGFAVAE